MRDSGRHDEAEPIFRNLSEQHPDFVGGWRGLAFIARQRSDRAQAIDHFKRAVALDPANRWLQNDLANELRDSGRHDEAEPIFRNLSEQHPDFVGGWRGLAFIARQRSDRAQAIDHFKRAVALDPGNLWLASDLAGELLEMGQIEEAETLGRRLVETWPGKSLAHIVLAKCLRPRAPKPEIIRTLEQALAAEPGDVHACLTLAGEYVSGWRLDEAEQLYDRALAAQPKNVSAWIGKAQIARRRERADEALAACAKALECEPANEWANIEYARELTQSGRYREAGQILHEALARKPDNPPLIEFQANVARAAGDFAAAKAHFDKLTRLDPASNSAQVELAIEEFRAGQAVAAMSRLEQLISVSPGFVRSWELLADFHLQIDDWPASLAYRQKALAIDGSRIWTHLEVAKLFANSGRFEQADEKLAQTLAHFGPQPEIAIVQADCFKARGEHFRARDVLIAGFQAFPASFDLRVQSIQLLVGCGDLAQAEILAAPSADYTAQQRARLAAMRGHIAAARWRSGEAYACFVEALAHNPAEIATNEWAARMALLCADVDAAASHNATARRNEPVHRIRHRGGIKPSQSHIGQMIDEYRLDASCLARLQQALRGDAPRRPLAELTLENPDYTPAAIAFLVSLRREGVFARARAAQSQPGRIPTTIAQYWDRNIPPDVARFCETWSAQNPGFAYRLFDDRSAGRFLQKLSPAARHAFDRAREPAMKGDLFRLAWLYAHGGYYADADDRCIAPISSIDPGGCDLLAYQEDYGTLANNFIGAVPRHPAIGLALNGAMASVRRGDSDLIWLSTGPGLMTRSVAAYLAEDTDRRLQNTAIRERHEVLGAVAMHCAAGYKTTNKHWSRAAFTAKAAK